MAWNNFSDRKPRRTGRYLCTTVGFGNKYHVQELYWDNKHQCFQDTSSKHIFVMYTVYNLSGERMTKDITSDKTDEVIAWMALPKPFKKEVEHDEME